MDSALGFKQALPAEMAIVDFDQALQVLKSGNVLGVPTETVYGLAARIDSEDALKKIFETKKRPFFDPLIVHLATSMDAKDFTQDWPELYKKLAERFWPGPLTLIAPKNGRISDLITAGLPDVGLRSPNHPLTQKLIDRLGVPVAAPSANMFGKTSPTTSSHVETELGGQICVLDGGQSDVGLESTVVKYDNAQSTLFVLRPGFISRTDLEEVCESFSVDVKPGTSKAAPGQLKAHYQPNAPVVVQFTEKEELKTSEREEFEERLQRQGLKWSTLKLPSSATLSARMLYILLREHSQDSDSAIWIPLHPKVLKDPSWEMIIDRLSRAASLIID